MVDYISLYQAANQLRIQLKGSTIWDCARPWGWLVPIFFLFLIVLNHVMNHMEILGLGHFIWMDLCITWSWKDIQLLFYMQMHGLQFRNTTSIGTRQVSTQDPQEAFWNQHPQHRIKDGKLSSFVKKQTICTSGDLHAHHIPNTSIPSELFPLPVLSCETPALVSAHVLLTEAHNAWLLGPSLPWDSSGMLGSRSAMSLSDTDVWYILNSECARQQTKELLHFTLESHWLGTSASEWGGEIYHHIIKSFRALKPLFSNGPTPLSAAHISLHINDTLDPSQ